MNFGQSIVNTLLAKYANFWRAGDRVGGGAPHVHPPSLLFTIVLRSRHGHV